MNNVENLMVRGATEYQEAQARRNATAIDQDRSDALASLNRRFDVADLLELIDSGVGTQLLGARYLGASAEQIGGCLLAAIDAYLERCADRSVGLDPDSTPAERPEPEVAAMRVLLGASVEGARQ